MADSANPSPEQILQRVRTELQTQMMQGMTQTLDLTYYGIIYP